MLETIPSFRPRLGIEFFELVGVLEDKGAVVVDKAFGIGVLGDQHVMAFEFDVEIMDVVFTFLVEGDGRAIDEMLGRNQHAVQEHRVFRRDEQVAPRQALKSS